jgi:cytochrome c oxidase subunit IV
MSYPCIDNEHPPGFPYQMQEEPKLEGNRITPSAGMTDQEEWSSIDLNSSDGDCSVSIEYGSEDLTPCLSPSVGTSIDLENNIDDDDDDVPYEPLRADQRGIKLYFKVWTGASILMFVLNVLNIRWDVMIKEPWWMFLLSIVFILIQAGLQWSVLEIPLMSFATLLVKPSPDEIGDGAHLTVVINYNLLASDEAEVDATLENAFDAYVGNLAPSVVAVLVSATGKQELKDYEIETRDNMRKKIFQLVMEEGAAWAEGTVVDEGRASRCFEPHRDPHTKDIPATFVETTLPTLAEKYARDFMIVQRVTRGRDMNTLSSLRHQHSQ